MFFYLEPEIAGGIGPSSELSRENGRLVVTRLNYEFDGWLGDALLETTPCFIVTDEARQMIERAALTGVSFCNVEVTRSDLFVDLYGERALPHFWWMIVAGKAEADDFGMASDLRLVASKRAIATLQKVGLAHAEVQPIGNNVGKPPRIGHPAGCPTSPDSAITPIALSNRRYSLSTSAHLKRIARLIKPRSRV